MARARVAEGAGGGVEHRVEGSHEVAGRPRVLPRQVGVQVREQLARPRRLRQRVRDAGRGLDPEKYTKGKYAFLFRPDK